MKVEWFFTPLSPLDRDLHVAELEVMGGLVTARQDHLAECPCEYGIETTAEAYSTDDGRSVGSLISLYYMPEFSIISVLRQYDGGEWYQFFGRVDTRMTTIDGEDPLA